MGVRVSVWNLKTRCCVNARHVNTSQNQKKFQEAVNACAYTLVVLVLCIFGTCRAFFLAEVFLTRCPLCQSFHVHPCLFVSRALELMSAQFPLM